MTQPGNSTNWNEFEDFRGSWDVEFPSLLEALTSTDKDSRAFARGSILEWPFEILDQVGRLGAVPDVIGVILRCAVDPNAPDRAELLKLAAFLTKKAPEYTCFTSWYRGTQEELLHAIESKFRSGVELFIDAIQSPDSTVRAAAAEAIGVAKDERASKHLQSLLQREGNAEVIHATLVSLGELKSVAALPEIIAHLASTDLTIRGAAAVTAVRISEPLYHFVLSQTAELVTLDSEIDRPRTHEVEHENLDVSIHAILQLKTMGPADLDWAVDHWVSLSSQIQPNNILVFFQKPLVCCFPSRTGRPRKSSPNTVYTN